MTGATGTIGSEVVDKLSHRHRVVRIGRGTQDIRWDLREPLSDEARGAFQTADVVVHAAADTRLHGGSRLEQVNVDAVRTLVMSLLAARARPRLIYISSAFAAAQNGAVHNNPYERSKRAAEDIVVDSGLEYSVVRPSLVIGESGTGRIKRFSGVYSLMRMLRLGLVPAIPGFDTTRVDLVPVDIVAQLITEAVDGLHEGDIITVASGPAAPTLAELVETLFDTLEDRAPDEAFDRPKFVTPDVYHRLFRPLVWPELSPAQRVLLETVEIFLPYFAVDHVFDGTLALTSDLVLETWRASVSFWLDSESHGPARGRSVWAPSR